MTIVKVLLNEKGKVVGTARPHIPVGNVGGPQSAVLVARQGQRMIDIEVDEKVLSLEPNALHAALSKYATQGKSKSGTRPRTAVRKRRQKATR